MTTPGLAAALVAWAKGDVPRIQQLAAERDALIAAFLNGGKARTTLTQTSINGKNFTALVNLSADEKLALLTSVLTQLGAIDAEPAGITYADFSRLTR